MHMTSCNVRVRDEKRVNKRAGFCGKRNIYSLILEYTTRLKVLNDLNLRIDMTGCTWAIATFSAIKRLANVGE